MRGSFGCNLPESFPCQFWIDPYNASREKFRKSESILTADLRVQQAAIMEPRQTGKATWLGPLKQVGQRDYASGESASVKTLKPWDAQIGIIRGRFQERGSLRAKLNL
jgi:hypothetical protein